MPMAPVYATAKSGVIHFTRSLAPRLKKRHIRICALCPQQVDTPMVSHHQHLGYSGKYPIHESHKAV